jgi:hypothetical protein
MEHSAGSVLKAFQRAAAPVKYWSRSAPHHHVQVTAPAHPVPAVACLRAGVAGVDDGHIERVVGEDGGALERLGSDEAQLRIVLAQE